MIKFLLILICWLPFQSFAAMPVTHVYLAEKWMTQFSPELYLFDNTMSRWEFTLGNLFPDIRYLGGVQRDETHHYNVTLLQIQESTCLFKKGILLHCFVDEQREKFLVDYGMYQELSKYTSNYQATLLKFIEDELFYDRIDHDYTNECFIAIGEGEAASGIDLNTISKWHQYNSYYLGTSPASMLKLLAQLNRGLFNVPPHIIKEWSILLPKLCKLPLFIKYADDLSAHFDELYYNSIKPSLRN